ncbi:hypothetical protein LTR56_022093 [Elasticomyces elasticus]|nr:hypothetical protein LTR56_022093 [Elasticomyces elasticus]KAK3629577.1 hypothetical protein LTR22_021854 [Elasticomyces elasticus]KAK4919727.1 hypothetical protein LTR49_012630 [Elasticomyces elasticus]KAK5758452.1 hypothetical protein LTS12_011474 [Elasticomyces elasticus]
MKFPQVLLFLLGFITTIHALALPSSLETISEAAKELYKRKGGGGGGGRASGSSSSSSSSGGSSAPKSGSGSSGSSTGSRGSTPSYGGGSYYGGGARAPYTSGRTSPGGVAPYFLAGGALAFFPGLWLYGAYAYPYYGLHSYHNNTSNRNESMPVQCYCANYNPCGCDNNTDSSYLDEVANNKTVSRVANVNGTDTLLINGTLENGTGDATQSSAAGNLGQSFAEMSGFWIVVAGVGYTMWFM